MKLPPTKKSWDDYEGIVMVTCPRCLGRVRKELAERTVMETGQSDMLHTLEACDTSIVGSVIES